MSSNAPWEAGSLPKGSAASLPIAQARGLTPRSDKSGVIGMTVTSPATTMIRMRRLARPSHVVGPRFIDGPSLAGAMILGPLPA
jgi:hypothetical protein